MTTGNISNVTRRLLHRGLKLLDKNVSLSSTIAAAGVPRHCQLCTYHQKIFLRHHPSYVNMESIARHSCFYSFINAHKMQSLSCNKSHIHGCENRNFHSLSAHKKFDGHKCGTASEHKRITRQMSVIAKGILDASPMGIQPYLRLIRFDKPIGTWLLYWPCTWSIAMAAEAGHLPDLKLLLLFGAGSFVMRGAGCIINDMWDKDFDKKVARTRLRPLATGEITPFQALVFLSTQLSLALAILLQLNYYSIILGASSMALVVVYPLAKRFTYWPQLILGVTLNWGVLLAWSELTGSLDWSIVPLYTGCVLYTMFYDTIYSHQRKEQQIPQEKRKKSSLLQNQSDAVPLSELHSDKTMAAPGDVSKKAVSGFAFNYGAILGWAAVQGQCDWTVVLPLYAGGICWTIVYDTIYAHQDKYDDMLIGVKSTALKFGDQTKLCLSGFSAITVAGFALTGYMCDQTWPYYLGVSTTAAHLAYQLYTVNLDDADDCASKFFSNTRLGLIMLLGTVFGTLLKKSKSTEDKEKKS